MQREKTIVRTGIIGILANVFLAGFKAVIGFISGSIAITLDAVNNLSDAVSSVITIVSTKLAGRQPDKKHPYGHGRIEYIAAVTISAIVIYAGITSLIESVKKIFTPETPDYTTAGLIIIAVAVLVKIVLGIYVKGVGKRVNSDSLVASGKDALLDSVISASTLLAAGIFIIWGVSLEAWLGAVISLVIIKSGIDMLRESISSILGERVDSGLSQDVKKAVLAFEDVMGVYDIILNNYGPENYIGSLHIEIPEDYSVRKLDMLERKITERVYADTGVIITGVGIYAHMKETETNKQIINDIRSAALGRDGVLQVHGITVFEDDKEIRFDVVIDYSEKNRNEVFQQICAEITEKYPDYKVMPTLDADITDF